MLGVSNLMIYIYIYFFNLMIFLIKGKIRELSINLSFSLIKHFLGAHLAVLGVCAGIGGVPQVVVGAIRAVPCILN